MRYNFENNTFSIELTSCSRPFKNLREEYKIRSREISKQNRKNILCINGGISSQAILQSFIEQDLEITTAFMHLPGRNDNDLEKIKILDKKYNIQTKIIEFNFQISEIDNLSVNLDVTKKIHILQRKFVSFLPLDHNIIYSYPDPFVYISPDSKNKYVCYSYYSDSISMRRSLENLNNSKNIFWFNDTPEIQSSIISDDIFDAAYCSSSYFDGNGLSKPEKDLRSTDRYDYYIKPLIYSKYWKDQLIYFPKSENIKDLEIFKNKFKKIKYHTVSISFEKFKNFILNTESVKEKFIENVEFDNSFKILGTEFDKDNNSITIKHTEDLFDKEIYSFFLEKVQEMTREGFRIEKYLPPDGSAIFAELNGEIIGLIAYSLNSKKSENLVWLILGAINHNHQQRGIYRILRKYLENISKEQGYIGIASHIHVNNFTALVSSQNQGAEKVYHYMVKWLDSSSNRT